MIEVHKTPQRLLTVAKKSKWVALHNPIIYELQRKDIQGTVVQTSATQFTFTLTSGYAEPDKVIDNEYASVGGNIYQILSHVHGGGNLLLSIVFTGVFSSVHGIIAQGQFQTSVQAGTFSTYVNLIDGFKNYYVEVDILGINAVNQYYVIGTAKYLPDTNGLIKVYANEWVKELADYVNDYDYIALNRADKKLSGSFNIRYREYWNSPLNPSTYGTLYYGVNQGESVNLRMFFVNGARQIADTLGQNLHDFVPVQNIAIDKAEWLSDFERPSYFRGYPFDLPFIYSDNICEATSKPILKREKHFPISETQQTGNTWHYSAAFDGNEGLYLNRMKIDEPAANIKVMQVNLGFDDNSQNLGMGVYVYGVYNPNVFHISAINTQPNAAPTM